MATTSDTLYWAVFVKDEMRTRWPVNTRYTDKDEEVVAEQIMSTPVTETIIFGNLWYSRSSSGLVPVEEGVLKNWHSGRIVLIGDAVHKCLTMTPDLGLGGACAVEDAVVLCNNLRNRMHDSSSKSLNTVSQDGITQLFHQYSNRQGPRAQRLCSLSGRTTRLNSSGTLIDQFVTRILMVNNAAPMAAIMGEVVREGELLDYATVKRVRVGNQNWGRRLDLHGLPTPYNNKREGGARTLLSISKLVLALVILCLLWTALHYPTNSAKA
ncbi:FAD binding domain protein, partial [Metarhizium brunneum ARSEF 3297]